MDDQDRDLQSDLTRKGMDSLQGKASKYSGQLGDAADDLPDGSDQFGEKFEGMSTEEPSGPSELPRDSSDRKRNMGSDDRMRSQAQRAASNGQEVTQRERDMSDSDLLKAADDRKFQSERRSLDQSLDPSDT